MPLASKANDGLSTLIEKKELTVDEWILHINELLDQIAPYIKNWKCESLERLKILRHEALYSYKLTPKEMCWLGEPKVFRKKNSSLSTRGIFFPVELNRGRVSGNGYCFIWGLTKSCKWIWAKLAYSVIDRGDKCEKADIIVINESDLMELICAYGVKPWIIFDTLANEVKKWDESRQELANESAAVNREVQFRQRLIHLKYPRVR